mmetsp:Transcript_59131/g.129717  ORF Transcript_59131/g.129717 Transcript_59131/m.129717 type:complete len:210 (+) Transcript_59131:786-1415(+)
MRPVPALSHCLHRAEDGITGKGGTFKAPSVSSLDFPPSATNAPLSPSVATVWFSTDSDVSAGPAGASSGFRRASNLSRSIGSTTDSAPRTSSKSKSPVRSTSMASNQAPGLCRMSGISRTSLKPDRHTGHLRVASCCAHSKWKICLHAQPSLPAASKYANLDSLQTCSRQITHSLTSPSKFASCMSGRVFSLRMSRWLRACSKRTLDST